MISDVQKIIYSRFLKTSTTESNRDSLEILKSRLKNDNFLKVINNNLQESKNKKNDLNLDGVLKYIRNLDCIDIVNLLFDTDKTLSFISNICDNYSSNNPHLSVHWFKICDINKVSKKKIILFKYLDIKDKNYLILMSIGETLMKYGFSIKRDSEFIICKKSKNLIIKENIYDHLKKFDFPLIDKWSEEEIHINNVKYCNMYKIKEYDSLYNDYKKYFESQGMNVKLINKVIG